MTQKTVILTTAMIVLLYSIGFCQNTIVLENGLSYSYESFKDSKSTISAEVKDGKLTIDKKDIKYFTKNDKLFTFHAKRHFKIRIKISKDATGNCRSGEIHAYKYYKAKDLIAQNENSGNLVNDPDWQNCFDKKHSKISSNKVIGLVAGIVAFTIGAGSFAVTISQL